MPDVSDSNTPIAGETRREIRERERQEVRARVKKWKGERRRKRLKRVGIVFGPVVVLLFILTQFGGDSAQTSDESSGAVATTAPSSGTTSPTATQPSGPLARYVSLDGSAFDEEVNLIRLFESELRLSSNAFNGLNNALGLPDQLGNEDGRRVGLWLLPGEGSLQIVEGVSISIFCGSENVIAANVGDGVVLCRSTLEEANGGASDGMGGFLFEPDASTGISGGWIACSSDVSTERARLEFRVNSTGLDDVGSADGSSSDVINGLKLSVCPSA
jgi:hypothetical protein